MKRKSVSDPPATEYVDSHSSQFDNPDMSSNGLLGLEDSGGGGGSSCKRARTIFTADQLEKMEQEFHKQQYVVGHERMYLANALNLTEAQVPNNLIFGTGISRTRNHDLELTILIQCF